MKIRRLLSWLLVIVMMAAMLPAGFADTSQGSPYYGNNYNAAGDGTSSLFPDSNNPARPSQGDAGSSTGGHTHSWQFLDTLREATCTAYGKIRMICYGCGSVETIYTDMAPHTWSEWEIIAEATDHSAGERQHTCLVCGLTEKESWYLPGTLVPGDTGKEVQELQELLNENGISTPTDGEYGKMTQDSVREAQRRHGLNPDGIAWLETIACLEHAFGEWEILREPTLTKTGLRRRICEKCGYEEKEDFVRELGPGASGEAVKRLQDMLEKLGYYRDRRDGYYGPGVSSAVEDFQKEHGLEATGIADEETLSLIAAEAGEDNGVPASAEKDPREPEPEPVPAPEPIHDREGDPEPEPVTDPTVLAIAIPDNNYNPGGRRDPISGIEVMKTVTSTPDYYSFYTKGEVIGYKIQVTNTGSTVILNAVVTDFINDASSEVLGTIENLYPGEGREFYYHYTVEESDVSAGFGVVKNTATASGMDDRGNAVYREATVYSEVGPGNTQEYPYLEKIVVNTPARGWFEEGEQIEYEIVLHNTGSLNIMSADIYDSFEGASPVWLANLFVPAHTDSAPVPYSHIVTQEEAAAGMVQNMAIAVCRLADRTIIQLSAEVEALTGLKEPEPPVSAPGSDCCIRTLTGKGEGIAEYTLEYCHIHEPVAQQVRGMIAAAGGNPGESVWKQASELWRTAIDEEYAAMSVSDEYRSAFYAWLGEYEAYLKAEYPEDTAMVAMRISEQLMNFCADLCYLNGTAPADRVDSLLTGRYQALAAATDAEACYRTVTDGGIVSYAEILCAEHRVPDTELAGALSVAASAQEKTEAFRKNRQNWLDELSRHATEKIMSSMDTDKAVLILNERNAFDRMLLAEESFLTGFYPGRPEVVQEIVANSAREHVIDFCG